METAGVWMLVAAAALIIATGLPAWMMLVGVALVYSLAGVILDVIPLALLSSIPHACWGPRTTICCRCCPSTC
jgi:TRAP-type mannitol/chloroaromatic compound transport system permease large subunit